MIEKKVMLIDLNSCSGCHACSVSCKAEHRAPQGLFRHRVQSVEEGSFPKVTRTFIPTLCQHCTEAPCTQSCPTGAVLRTDQGIVYIDEDTCVGTGTCVSACPYGAIFIDPKTSLAVKCDFCRDRLDEGESPACVSTCPTNALIFGSVNDEKIMEQLESGKYTQWEPEKGTKPSVFYQGLGSRAEQALTRINL